MFVKGRIIVSCSSVALLGIIIFSIFSIATLGAPVFAETVVKSIGFEKTTLIEYTNNEGVPIKTIRMWLGQDSGDFLSFKTEKGWTGMKTAEGLLVFVSEDPLAPGESVKFGIKTQIQNPGINWRTIDTNGNDLTTGKTFVGEQPQQPPQDTPPQNTGTIQQPRNFDNAAFRIIPDSPGNGDTIRVVGDGFPPNTRVEFFIDQEKLEDFTTDDSGRLIGTTKIPVDKEADRVEFSVTDDQGNKKTVSIRIQHKDTQLIKPATTTFKVTQITETVEPGKTARATGTGKPGNTITINYKDASGLKIQEAAVVVDAQGNWVYERVVPPDAVLGTRVVEFYNGKETITKTVNVTVTRLVHVTPSQVQYNPGDTMKFNGTAEINKPVEVVIKDPIGNEIFFDNFKMNGTNIIDFEFPTSQSSLKGTYVVLLTQDGQTEILRIGLGERPTEQIVTKFDKLNYATTEKAVLTIKGPAGVKVSILVVDPSDLVVKGFPDTVTLGPDGSGKYEIDLSGFKAGGYTVVLKYLQTQVEEVFAVGLQQGSGEIKMQTTKTKYGLGDPVLVLGTTANKNVLLSLKLIDPDGNVIKSKQTFSDKEGKFSDGTFRIPSNAKQGMWKIEATSGTNRAESPLEVVGTVEQAFVVQVDKPTYSVGETMTISGTGAGKTQTAIIKITDSNGNEIEEITVFTTDAGSFQPIWVIPEETDPGEYKIRAQVGNQFAEATFTVQ